MGMNLSKEMIAIIGIVLLGIAGFVFVSNESASVAVGSAAIGGLVGFLRGKDEEGGSK